MNTYKSRYGYHSIDYSTFVKLRKLYKAYWQAVADIAKWKRWVRKRPENRFGLEPTFCRAFVRTPKYVCQCTPADLQAWGWRHVSDDSRGVWEAFHATRQPKATEAEVVACKLSIAQIDSLLAEVEKYEASKAA